MKIGYSMGLATLGIVLLFAGCKNGTPEKPKTTPTAAANKEAEDEIKASLAKLSLEDRKLAEEQKFCVVSTKHRLGSMGMPTKVMVKDQPVFLCCDSCKKAAVGNPDKTLAKVKEFRAATGNP